MSQDSAISSNLFIATSIRERKGEGSSPIRVDSSEDRLSNDTAEGVSSRDSCPALKEDSNASSLATVVEETAKSKSHMHSAEGHTKHGAQKQPAAPTIQQSKAATISTAATDAPSTEPDKPRTVLSIPTQPPSPIFKLGERGHRPLLFPAGTVRKLPSGQV